MRFGLLGPLVIVDEAGRLVDLRGPQPRLLLTMLLAAAGRGGERHAIIDAMQVVEVPTAGGSMKKAVEARAHQAAQAASGGHPRARRPQDMGVLTQGVLAHRRLSDPCHRPAQRLLGQSRPARFHRTLPPLPGC